MLNIDRASFASPNHAPRTQAIASIVLHTGEGTRASDLAWLTKPQGDKSVSSHYYVCRDGQIYQLVSDNRVAYHAGLTHYAGLSNWNAHSLGIETEHKRGQDYPVAQWDALRELYFFLIQRHSIKLDRRVAHRWAAPTRKHDPSDTTDDHLFNFFSAFGHAYAQPWRPYRVTVDVARVRSTPTTDAPIARKLNKGATFWGTDVKGSKVGTDPNWIARRYGGYVHRSLLTVAKDMEPI
jgi:N-acetyl-anhydromuramyl-L-alanine amidase AmpD